MDNSQKISVVGFTVSEITAIASALVTLSTMIERIREHAPDVWASVQADFNGALNDWQSKASPDVASIVAGSGQLPGMPSNLLENATKSPEEIAALERQFAESVVAAGLATPMPHATEGGAIYSGAESVPLGTHTSATDNPR